MLQTRPFAQSKQTASLIAVVIYRSAVEINMGAQDNLPTLEEKHLIDGSCGACGLWNERLLRIRAVLDEVGT